MTGQERRRMRVGKRREEKCVGEGRFIFQRKGQHANVRDMEEFARLEAQAEGTGE